MKLTRIVSLILALVAAVSLFTAVAFAADEDKITEPQERTAYYLCVTQGDKNGGTRYYHFGYVVDSSKALYLDSTSKVEQAIPVFLEKSGDGWKLFQVLDDQVQYIYIYKKGSELAVGLTEDSEEASVYTWNSDYNTLVTNFGGTDYYIGVNSALNTDGSVKTAYTKFKALKLASIEKGHNFPAYFVSVPEGVELPTLPESTEPETKPTEPETEPTVAETEPSAAETTEPETKPTSAQTEPTVPETTAPDASEPSGSDAPSGGVNPIGIVAVAVLAVCGVAVMIWGRKKNNT